MLSLVLCTLFAVATAAPFNGGLYQPHVSDNLFDMQNFMDDLSRDMDDLSRKLDASSRKMNDRMSKLEVDVPTTYEYVGNQYQINISLPGYEEKDITLKNRRGLFTVEAKHTDSMYMRDITLPSNVSPAWSSEFQNGVLRIVFPLKSVAKPSETITETVI